MDQVDNMTDQEDFEMRPLTEGLGFHQRPIAKKELKKRQLFQDLSPRAVPLVQDNLPRDGWEAPKKSAASTESLSELSDLLSESIPDVGELDRSPEIGPPAPRDVPAGPALTPENFMGGVFAGTGLRRGAADSPTPPQLIERPLALPALVVDGLLIAALTLIFMIVLLVITRANLEVLALQMNQNVSLQLALFALVGSVGLAYFCVSRVLCGQSLGEWAFDYQVGDNGQREDRSYGLRILGRSTAILLTGIVVLPVLSLLVRRDLASFVGDLRLYQRG